MNVSLYDAICVKNSCDSKSFIGSSSIPDLPYVLVVNGTATNLNVTNGTFVNGTATNLNVTNGTFVNGIAKTRFCQELNTELLLPNGIDAIENWRKNNITTAFIQSVCWSSERKMFVAVGAFTGGSNIIYSFDGVNWSYTSPATGQWWNSVCWSAELGLFCATSTNSTLRVIISSDGVNWTQYASADDTVGWNSVCWSPELGLFCAVGLTGIMTSSNGTTWTLRSNTIFGTSVCWSPQLGLFCSVGCPLSGVTNIATSSNGISWTLQTVPPQATSKNRMYAVAWSPQLNQFCVSTENRTDTIVIGSNNDNRIFTSSNGTTWTARNLPSNLATNCNNSGGNNITCNNTQNLLVGQSISLSSGAGVVPTDTIISAIVNSTTFTTNNTITGLSNSTLSFGPNLMASIVWSPELNQWYTHSMNSGMMFISQNGINWSTYNNGISSMVAACWSSDLYCYCISSHDVSSGRNMYISRKDISELAGCYGLAKDAYPSLNPKSTGIKAIQPSGWTASINGSASNRFIEYIVWSPELRMFVAATAFTGNINLIYSFDGLNWLPVVGTIAGQWWKGVCWSPQLRLFVAVHFTAPLTSSGNKVATSSDGINWTYRASANDNLDWYKVCWSSQLSTFVAVAGSGGIMTSQNGISWVMRSTTISGNDVVWSPEISLFAISSNSNIYTSPDGTNWTLRSTPFVNSSIAFSYIGYSSLLKQFVASTYFTGTSLIGDNNKGRIAISSDGINWNPINLPSNLLLVTNNSGTTITVASTTDLRVGQIVSLYSGSGTVPNGTRVASIINSTQFTTNNTITGLTNNNSTLSFAVNTLGTPIWSPQLEQWLIPAFSNSGCYVSNDGRNWTFYNIATVRGATGTLCGCWSPELGCYAIGSQYVDGAIRDIYLSPLQGRIPTSYNVFDNPFNRIDATGNWSIQQVLKSGTYTSGDVTPSVLGTNIMYITNSGGTTITNFTNPSTNQQLTLVFTGATPNTTIQSGVNIRLSSGVNFVATQYDVLTLLYTGTEWVETSRSLNA